MSDICVACVGHFDISVGHICSICLSYMFVLYAAPNPYDACHLHYTDRVMGWVIRFVKNRNRIAENIVMATSRQSAMRQIHPAAMSSLRNRLHARGIRPAANSFLKHANDTLEDREYLSTPGSYAVAVNHTSRNTHPVRNCPRRLKALARQLCSDLHIHARRVDTDSTKVMTNGITINGRAYKAGSHCLVISRINRNSPHLANDPSQLTVVTIDRFYTLQIDNEETVFVKVATHAVQYIHMESIWVVEKETREKRYFHVDSIRSKLHFCPHWQSSKKDWVCAIPIWTAL